MMRRQQMRREGGSSWDDSQNNYQPNSRTYVNGDGTSVTVNYESGKRSGSGQEEDEDPLIILGRLVKDATKQLWRKVSTPSLPTPVPEHSEKVVQQQEQSGSSPPERVVVIASQPMEEDDRSDDTLSEGGVWEESVDERFVQAAARRSDVAKADNGSLSPAGSTRIVPFPSSNRIDAQIPLEDSLMEQTASLDISDKDEDATPSPSSSRTARQHPTSHSPPPPSPPQKSPRSLDFTATASPTALIPPNAPTS